MRKLLASLSSTSIGPSTRAGAQARAPDSRSSDARFASLPGDHGRRGAAGVEHQQGLHAVDRDLDARALRNHVGSAPPPRRSRRRRRGRHEYRFGIEQPDPARRKVELDDVLGEELPAEHAVLPARLRAGVDSTTCRCRRAGPVRGVSAGDRDPASCRRTDTPSSRAASGVSTASLAPVSSISRSGFALPSGARSTMIRLGSGESRNGSSASTASGGGSAALARVLREPAERDEPGSEAASRTALRACATSSIARLYTSDAAQLRSLSIRIRSNRQRPDGRRILGRPSPARRPAMRVDTTIPLNDWRAVAAAAQAAEAAGFDGVMSAEIANDPFAAARVRGARDRAHRALDRDLRRVPAQPDGGGANLLGPARATRAGASGSGSARR